MIKSGGSQEARDRVQRRHIARENQQLDQHISDQPGDAVVSPWAHGREKRRVSEHTGTVQRLQQYYAKQRGELEACCGSRANSERSPEPRAVTNVMGPGTCPGGAVAPIGLGENSAVNAPAARLASSAMTPEGDSLSADGTGPEGHPSSRGVIGSLSRKGQGIQGGLQGEDVSQLLTRATVGYDWVDDFRAQETRVRGAFTERDMVGLEVRAGVMARCARASPQYKPYSYDGMYPNFARGTRDRCQRCVSPFETILTRPLMYRRYSSTARSATISMRGRRLVFPTLAYA